jgi:Protein of unknown function (DUF2809)
MDQMLSVPLKELPPRMTNISHRRPFCSLFLLITIPIGLAIRLIPLGLPWFFYKYLGSILWAVALYWFLAAVLPKLCSAAIGSIAVAIATVIEFSRLIPIAPIDAFRLTFAGKILLGRYFSIKNIFAYILGITLAAVLDHFFIAQQQQNPASGSPPNPAARDTL